MNQDNGYIYFRSHQSFDEFDVYKIGSTNDIHKRDTQYVRDEYNEARKNRRNK